MPEFQQYNYDTLAAGTDSFQDFFFFQVIKCLKEAELI